MTVDIETCDKLSITLPEFKRNERRYFVLRRDKFHAKQRNGVILLRKLLYFYYHTKQWLHLNFGVFKHDLEIIISS